MRPSPWCTVTGRPPTTRCAPVTGHSPCGLPGGSSHFWYETPEPGHPAERTGRVDLGGLEVAPGTHAYLCGPLPFMRAVRSQLLDRGVAPADVHYEVFGPDLWLAQD